jgi:uncharacterized membrane protein YidH (DUF202 family)
MSAENTPLLAPSACSAHEALPTQEIFDYKCVGGRLMGLCLVSVATLLLALLLGFNNPKQFAFSWLFAGCFFFTLMIGSLFWVIIHHAVDSAWSVGIRRQLENISCLLPLLALLLLPLLFVAPQLWSWMADSPAQNRELAEKAAFLNINFFWVRTLLYFVLFGTVAALFRYNSLAQDRDGEAIHTIRNRRIAFFIIPIGAIALSFWSFDWIMSLNIHWYSTIWGIYIFAGSVVGSLSFIILLANALRSAGYLKKVLTTQHNYTFGKFLLAFTLFWAWIAFVQYMLIWYANIPEETAYYTLRTNGSWKILGILLVVGHFFVPFLLLLLRTPKASVSFLGLIAGWMLAMHLLDIYLMILPVLHPEGFHPAVLDVVAVLAIGSTLGAVFLKRLGDSPLWPTRDPRLAEAIHYIDS